MISKISDLSTLETNIRVVFKNKNLLKQAFIHRSYLNEVKEIDLKSNERLEFLGDSILSFWVSKEIYNKFPDSPEGNLTLIRTHLVKTETLTALAIGLDLGKYLLMSKGEEDGGGKSNPALLANSFEAMVGAIFLDQGFEETSIFLSQQFSGLLSQISDLNSIKDSKSTLQELVQAKGYPSPTYRQISALGPDHQKTFTMGVYIEEKLIASGASRSKQEAEESAAKTALSENALEKLPKIK